MFQFAFCCLFSSGLLSFYLSSPDWISLLHLETFIGFDCRLDSNGNDSFSGDSRKTRATITTSHRNFPSRLCLSACSRSVTRKLVNRRVAPLSLYTTDPLLSIALILGGFNVSDDKAPGAASLSATPSSVEEDDFRPNLQWAWSMNFPKAVSPIFSPINFKFVSKAWPNVKNEDTPQIFMVLGDWNILSEIIFGFTIFSICSTRLYLSFGMNLPVGSPGSALFRFSSSFEEKQLPIYPLPMERGVFSALWPSVCFSSFIGLSSCGAVSTGPEDAIEITLVVLVDETWTSTSHYVTILQLSDFVVKASSTHSSIVLNPLSSSVEDLSYLVDLCFVCYAYCQKGWKFPFFYCIEDV